MIRNSSKFCAPVSLKVYGWLLSAYPAEFRREYGPLMAQVFRDRCREKGRVGGHAGLLRLWMETLLDLIQTAPKEQLQKFGKGIAVMKAAIKILLALVAYVVLFMLGGKFLVAMREHLPYAVGTMLDSLIAVGILFNLIVVLLVTTSWLAPARAVLTAGLASAILLMTFTSILAVRVPDARPNALAILGMVVSWLIWFGVHWLWAQKKTRPAVAV